MHRTEPVRLRRRALLGMLLVPVGAALAACATGQTTSVVTPAAPTVSAPQASPPTSPPPAPSPAPASPTAVLQPPTRTPAPPAPTTAPATVAPTRPATAPPAVPAGTTTPATGASAPAPCASPLPLTPAQTEGPYYRANPPQRASLREPGMAGTTLMLTGRVQTPACAPIAGARVDIWQADDAGRYDNTGYRLRGYVVTDAEGVYRIETIVPGLYPGRTRHIHVKVVPPNRPALTTQLYFPNEAANARDGIFDQRLVMKLADAAGAKTGTFDVVIAAG